MPDTPTFRRRKLPLILLGLVPAILLCGCNRQEKQELAAALDRAEGAAQRAENAQHAAEAAAVRAQTDRLAAAHDEAAPPEEQKADQQPETNRGPAQENQPSASNPG